MTPLSNPCFCHLRLLLVLACLCLGEVMGQGSLPATSKLPPSAWRTDAGALPATGGSEGQWLEDWPSAQHLAQRESRTLFVFFYSPMCGWCRRMEQEVLLAPEIRKALAEFVLVKVNLIEDDKTPARFRVRGTPTIVFLSPEGRESARVDGFVKKEVLQAYMASVLGGRGRASDEGLRLSLGRMREGKLTPEDWAGIATALGDDRYRDEIRRGVLDVRPIPRAALVALLEHPLLAVRLGALELLEELAGEDFGFDPWRASAERGRDSLSKWQAWASQTNASNALATVHSAVLAPEDIERYLQEALSDDLGRAGRARRMLERGGAAALAAVRAYGAAHPELSFGALQKLRELRYCLLLAPVPNGDASSLAHRLLFGNLDGRLRALQDAASGRQLVVPVIRDFLTDPDPLIRETAIDSLAAAGGRKVVAIFDEHLQRETDVNVTYAALRQLGNLRSKRALDLDVRYLNHTNEDLVVVALESLAKMRSDAGIEAVAKCLADPRWRVRVAALKTAETLHFSSLTPQVANCLDDTDDFVRGAAVGALAQLGAKAALPRLEALFNREDNLKGPIIQCLYRADQAIPTNWLKRLDACAPSVWLSVLDQIQMADEKLAPLLSAAAAHRDADVATTALRKLGPMVQENPRLAKVLAEQMLSGDRRRQLAVMTTLDVPVKLLSSHQPNILRAHLNAVGLASQTTSRTRPPSQEVEAVFAAFESAPATAAAGQKPTNFVEDVFQAFEGGGTRSENPVETYLRVSRECLAKTKDAELSAAAARLLVHLGDEAGIPRLLADLPGLAEDQRMQLARSLGRVRTLTALPLIDKLLADPAAEVRQVACQSVAEEGADEACLRLILSALTRPGSVLTPADANYGLSALVRRTDIRKALVQDCRSLLETNRTDSLRTFGLILLEGVGTSEIETNLEPFFTSSSPWQRRAAYHALGKINLARLRTEIVKLASDPSDYVREVVPHALRPQNLQLPWTDYLDERTSLANFNYYSDSRDESYALAPEALAVLKQLCQDRSERIRFQAFFCLIGHRQPVDLIELARLLEQLPRNSELREQFSSYILQQHATLGKEFAVLVPLLEFRYRSEEQIQKMREHFAINDDGDLPAETAAVALARTAIASYVTSQPRSALAATAPENYQLVYFSKPGCKECASVAKLLAQLKETFPHLRILEHDINKTSAAQLNEALCSHFQVPVSIRLVAPAVFCGGGFLIKDDITLARLGQMLERAAGVPATQWLVIPQTGLTEAHRQIATRFEHTSLGMVLFAGLLDGINPCAFATIVFLLSYLQVARKSRSQIRQIAIAYIAGVFLAYFLIGFGLSQVAMLVSRARWAGTLVTYLMAGFAFIVMCLSFRDGWLALQGRATDMSLQLPAPLKGRIHGLIRQSMRQAHFVLVAFFLGAAISLLELACTGQVYLPTITYMVQQGENRATWDLLLYNLAFIVPLTTLFFLHQYGLRSESLLGLFKRRVAWIKFATALLFLFLAMFLVYGR